MNTCLSSPATSASCAEQILCRCLQVTEDTVIEAMISLDIRSVKDLRQHTGAGDGCTACHRKLRKYIDQYVQACPAP